MARCARAIHPATEHARLAGISLLLCFAVAASLALRDA